jgi:hypothetical protein
MLDTPSFDFLGLTERAGFPAAAVPITARRARIEHFMVVIV